MRTEAIIGGQEIVDLFLIGRGLKTVEAAENGMLCMINDDNLGEVIESIEARRMWIDKKKNYEKQIALELSVYGILHGIAEKNNLLQFGKENLKTRLYPRGFLVNLEDRKRLIVPLGYVDHWNTWNESLENQYVSFDTPLFFEHFQITQDAEKIRRTGLLGGSAVTFLHNKRY